MIASFVLRAQLAAKSFGRKAVFGTLGGIILLVGVGFLGAAGWVWLAQAHGPIVANLVSGSLFLLIGVLVLAYARRPPRIVSSKQTARLADPMAPDPDVPHAPSALTTANIVQAFTLGLAASRLLRGRR